MIGAGPAANTIGQRQDNLETRNANLDHKRVDNVSE